MTIRVPRGLSVPRISCTAETDSSVPCAEDAAVEPALVLMMTSNFFAAKN